MRNFGHSTLQSLLKNIAYSKEHRVSAEVIVKGNYAEPDYMVAPRVWSDVLSFIWDSSSNGRAEA